MNDVAMDCYRLDHEPNDVCLSSRVTVIELFVAHFVEPRIDKLVGRQKVPVVDDFLMRLVITTTKQSNQIEVELMVKGAK